MTTYSDSVVQAACEAINIPIGKTESFESWFYRAARTVGTGCVGEWRSDPTDPFDDEELWCQRCDAVLDTEWRYCPYCGGLIVNGVEVEQ